MTKSGTVLVAVGAAGVALLVLILIGTWRRRQGYTGLAGVVSMALALGLLLRLAAAWGMPDYFAPDERPHFKYVAYLHEHHALPVQTAATNAPTNDWEYYQPPLYYLLAQPFYALGSELAGEQGALHAVRLFSVLLWWLGAVAALRVVRRLSFLPPGQQAFAMALFTLLPAHVVGSAMVNNDNLAIPLTWLVVFTASSLRRGLGPALWLGLMLGLLINTKLTGALGFVYVALLAAGDWWQHRASSSSAPEGARWPYLLTACMLGTLIWVPMAWRNLAVYGSLTAEAVANVPVKWPGPVEAVSATLAYMGRTFWASAGPSHNISHGFPVLGVALTLLAAWGWIGRAFNAASHDRPATEPAPTVTLALPVAALAGAFTLNLLLVLRMGFAYGQGQGRFFFPMMPAVACILGIGLAYTGWGRRLLGNGYAVLAGSMVYAVSFVAFSIATAMRLLGGTA